MLGVGAGDYSKEAKTWISSFSVFILVSLLLWAYNRTRHADLGRRHGGRPGEVEPQRSDQTKRPLSVNYHFTRQCNYQCGFCFHTAKTSFVLPIEEAKRGLKLLSDAGEQRQRA